jgi:terminase small subunit-like protein
MAKKVARVGARPSSYTPEQVEAICALIAQGKSLRSICERADMPSKSMVMRWLAEHEEFRDQYARAHEQQADRLLRNAWRLPTTRRWTSSVPRMRTAKRSCASITKTSSAPGCGSIPGSGCSEAGSQEIRPSLLEKRRTAEVAMDITPRAAAHYRAGPALCILCRMGARAARGEEVGLSYEPQILPVFVID